MSATVAQAIKVLEERANEDAALAEAVLFLVEDVSGPRDPFTKPGQGVLAAARSVSEHRQRQRQDTLVKAALDTAEVVSLVSSINDRKAVDRRRRRGQLLGWRAGARTLHPVWQFDRRLGDTRPGLPQVLAALADAATDAQAADELMSSPREDLGGRTLADLFAAGRIETVVRLILASKDQS